MQFLRYEDNAYTFFLMSASLAGMIIGKKYNLNYFPFSAAFVLTPALSLLATRNLDCFYTSSYSTKSFEAMLEHQKDAREAFQIVSKESDQYIQGLQQKKADFLAKLALSQRVTKSPFFTSYIKKGGKFKF